ncbi:isoprenyl transferase [Cryomorpha ignava]|uniref:Isoprenyl transferase n=1 Tax=Cryomorpha ignava TaxID=101383 RepID=A0A7K3WKA9_9FLAO|nr:isoprenyl transferase [Cryomorpha ignava]NEN21968.1 isoprenyl transferase [Cryomorpha ignava]
MSLKSKIKSDLVPQHIAVIMDGNGRWAKNRGEDRVFGHLNGVNSVRETLEAATEIGVKFLTLYAFSTENWDRPREEVSALMDLLVQTILKEIDSLQKNEVSLKAIGDLSMLPQNCHNALLEAIDKTSKNERITLTLALSYSSRWEIQKAVQEIARDVKSGEITPDDIDQNTISQYLETRNYPDPELLIRTSGEKRISNFLLWQIAYSELYFTETLWPDFKKENFFEAVVAYQNRERRFGKISEQNAH